VRGRGASPGRAGPGLELQLAGPDEEAPGTVVDLGPLDAAALRELVSGHVGEVDLDDAAATVRERSGGWPGRAHAAARSWQREAARASVRVAAAELDESAARAHEARRRLAEGVLDLQGEQGPQSDGSRCPWPGLAAYDVADGAWFAGRERLVAELVARVSGPSFLAVVGASGSGKSSLVRAGLLAALADDALPGSSGWTHLVLRPGPHPMRELAQRVLGARRPDRGAILESLVRDGEPGDRTVLVVDQAEELWTVCDDEGEREAFLDTLVEVASDPGSGVTLVIALRADFLDRLAGHAAMTAQVNDHAVLVGAPSTDDVRRVVERPARRAGLRLDVGLVDAVVEDAGAEPGLLPLLSTSLAQLWEAREGDRLTFAGYVGSGGLSGAIGHLAEQAWGELSEEDQEAARAVLLRLAGPGEGVAVARRRVSLAELGALPATRDGVVERLADARLLTLSDGHVEVAHEALFREWPRLRGWLAEDAAGRAVQRRLAVAAGDWAEEGREPALLWRGARLEAGIEVAALRPEEVTATEREFLDAGAAAADAERREVEERAATEVRRNRRLRGLLAGAVVLLLVAALAGVVALVARDRADAAAEEAEQAAVAADAKRLAASALNVEYPDLALLTAVEATRLEQSPETYGALLTLLARQPDVVTRFRTPDRFLRNAVSPDGRTVYVSENGGVMWALDSATGDVRWRAELAGQAASISPSPDGRQVNVVVFADGYDEVVALDPADGSEVDRLGPQGYRRFFARGAPPYLGFGSGWTTHDRFVIGNDTHALVLDEQLRVVDSLRWPGPADSPFGLVVWPDGWVSVNGDGEFGPTTVIDLDRGGREVGRTAAWIAAVSPDGRRALEMRETTVGISVRLLDGRTLRPVSRTWPIEGFVQSATFSPDGRTVALGVGEELQLRDGRTLAPQQVMLGHSGAVMALAWTGEQGEVLWTAGRDGSAVAFDTTGGRGVVSAVPSRGEPNAGEESGDLAVWTDAQADRVNRAYLLRPGDDRGRPLPMTGLGDCLCQAAATDLLADGSTVLAGIEIFTPQIEPVTDRGHLLAWDTGSRQVVGSVELPWPVRGVGSSPDGSTVVVQSEEGAAVVDTDTWTVVHGPVELEPGAVMADGVATVEFSPDGRRVVLVRGERVVVRDPTTGEVVADEPLWSADADEPISAAFTPDGEDLLVGSLSGWRYVLDPETLEPRVPRRLIVGGFVLDVEISPDGRTAATLGTDGDVVLWDTATWRPYGEPVLDDRGWGLLGFDDDSTTLRVDYQAGPWMEVDVRPAAWVDAACQAAHRDLTADENAVLRPGLPARPTCD
ncbi:PQQ-binding-like beta-propeller repeat protein, partial [Nocardioides aestuarii]